MNRPSVTLILFQTLLAVFSFHLLAYESLCAEIKTGDIAPNVVARDMDGRLVFCKSVLKEKPIILSFFFTECVPCKKEIPELQALNEIYKNKIHLYLVATDREGADAVKPYVEKLGITIDVLIDKYSDLAAAFGVSRYPSLFIIGRDSRVLYHCYGYDKDNIIKIEELIKRLK